jgi:hypothetical protein
MEFGACLEINQAIIIILCPRLYSRIGLQQFQVRLYYTLSRSFGASPNGRLIVVGTGSPGFTMANFILKTLRTLPRATLPPSVLLRTAILADCVRWNKDEKTPDMFWY